MALLPLLVVIALAVAVGTAAALLRRPGPSSETTVAAARRHASGAALLAWTAGALVAGWVGVRGGDLGSGGSGAGSRTLMLVPIVFGVVHTLVLLLGELTWPRPAGQLRRARLVHRGPLDAAPRWLVRTSAAALALALVTVAAAALLADDSGRRIARQDGPWASAHGPFPGWSYGGPALVGLVVLTAAVAAALRVVAGRAAVVTADDRVETALRRASAHRVLRGAAASVLALTGGLLTVAGLAVRGVGDDPTPLLVLRVSGVVVALAGLLTVLAALVLLAVPAPVVPAGEPVAA